MRIFLTVTCLPRLPLPRPYLLLWLLAGVNLGRGHGGCSGRCGRSLPNKCNARGSMDRILSSRTAPGATLLKWSIAKRKMIIQKYGSPSSIIADTVLLDDVSYNDSNLYGCDDLMKMIYNIYRERDVRLMSEALLVYAI
jgi:hypothetical protein